MEKRERIIQNYIDGYNEFDIDKMVADFDESIVFENIADGKITLSLTGLTSFRKQAEQAKAYFSYRKQTIKSYIHHHNETEVEIDYKAVTAMDFNNGLKKGEELHLSGKSVFTFKGNKIIKLTDIS
jgi:hypothetical protein